MSETNKDLKTYRCCKCGIVFDDVAPGDGDFLDFFENNPGIALGENEALCEACHADFELWWKELPKDKKSEIMQEAIRFAFGGAS